MNFFRPTAASLLALLLLAQPTAAEEAKGTSAEDQAEQRRHTIVISGDDAELVSSVAAELRAAGFDVVVVGPEPKAGDDSTIVSVERVGDSVIVHATRADGNLDAELLESTDADGMSDQEATALRAAEAIRSLVNTSKKKQPPATAPTSDVAEAAPSEATEQSPEVDTPPPVPPATVTTATMVEPNWLEPDDLDDDVHHTPIIRVGVFGGAGMVVPAAVFVFGASLRGQITPNFNVAGLLMGTRNVGAFEVEDGDYNIYGARAALLASWEILGADHTWTPSIGGGMFAEARYWEGMPAHFGSRHGDEPILSLYTPFYEGAMVGTGLSATAGISVAHPWRFRFDVHADVRMVTVELDGNGHDDMAPDLAPTVMGTVGLEYDFITRPVLRTTASR